MIRAVLDANVMVSGLISRKGPPGRILDAYWDDHFQLFISPQILQELTRVLEYPRIRKRLEQGQAVAFLSHLAALSQRTSGKLKLNVLTRDPSDNIYLACAVESECNYLVTGNGEHFEEVGDVFRGVQIITPRTFLGILNIE